MQVAFVCDEGAAVCRAQVWSPPLVLLLAQLALVINVVLQSDATAAATRFQLTAESAVRVWS